MVNLRSKHSLRSRWFRPEGIRRDQPSLRPFRFASDSIHEVPLSESRESKASDDVPESRIVAERVETGIDFDPHQAGGALIDPLF